MMNNRRQEGVPDAGTGGVTAVQEGRGHPSAQRVFRTSDTMGSPSAVFLVEELFFIYVLPVLITRR